ncbi:GntR family transcriptional regulator [Pelobium manganitolerans]|uniref:GntR family transcriptional regulator n=1 Tax=Pelobium manganitolerans TaxID=1842495 RepID=A0A419SBA5_9SPHI|nr:rhamnogalacturonan acetylesterase [Pelobium manganitolerans]RKD20105.1 GntR family transcriptional regulator [Pelobium manganitolerans]
MKKFFIPLVVLAFLALSFTNKPKITVYLIGDSTLSIKAVNTYPETGWGMPFAWFFKSDVKVDDRAMNGRSTGSFLKENRWQPIVDSLKAGDYVLIQFGHNDEVPTKKTYTTPEQYVTNLTKYVKETREKGAMPVLITPVARRAFVDGKPTDTHKEYAQLVRDLAKKLDVPMIDLTAKSMALLAEMGEDKSALLYNHLKPGQNPNYPKGKEDNTHFNELGARKMAELVLQGIRELQLPLANYTVDHQ